MGLMIMFISEEYARFPFIQNFHFFPIFQLTRPSEKQAENCTTIPEWIILYRYGIEHGVGCMETNELLMERVYHESILCPYNNNGKVENIKIL